MGIGRLKHRPDQLEKIKRQGSCDPEIQAETLYDAEAAVDAEFDGNVEILKKTITVAAIAVRRKDTFRVKEVLTLSGNKPDIDTLLWQDLRLRGVNTKPLDGKSISTGS